MQSQYLTVKEAVESSVIQLVAEGRLSAEEASKRLSVHRTTIWRKLERFESNGPAGLRNQARGKPSNRSTEASIREGIVRMYQENYQLHGFRVAHFYEEASKDFPAEVSYPTVVRWLKAEGVTTRTRRSPKHRSRRPRKEAFGEMLQMDTSIHDWMNIGRLTCLISAMDDATNTLCGVHMSDKDTTLDNMRVLKRAFLVHGLPISIYVDRSPIFKVTRTGGPGRIQQPDPEKTAQTQVARALEELGIELIYAYSPQAKGRIERSFGTWQGRLVPELRKEGIKELLQANAYVQEKFIPKFNARFATDPRSYASAFVPLLGVDLDPILAQKVVRTVTNDHVITWAEAGVKLKILPSKTRTSYAKTKVEIRKHIDGKTTVLYKGEPVPHEPLSIS